MDHHTVASGPVELVSTRDVSEFTQLVSERFAPLTVGTDRAEEFRGAIRGRGLGRLEVFDVRATQHQVERTDPVATQTPKGSLMLHLQLSGVGIMRQSGREAMLQPGDLGFYESDKAYSLGLDDRFRNVILVFPRQMLALSDDAVGQLTATRIAGTEGFAPMIVPFLTQLAGNLGQVPAHSSLRLAHNTVELIATMLQGMLGVRRQHRPTEGREFLLEQLRAYIEDNLADPGLDPGQIASAHFISVRQLHDVFSRDGSTVAAWIRFRRLERCRADLTDRRLDFRGVGAVGAQHGLMDPGHFSRLFRNAYGESPSEFRRRLQRAEPQT